MNIEWIDIRDRLPTVDKGAFIISVSRENYTYKAVAFFDISEKKWFYSDKGEKGDLVTDRVNGWIENFSVYIG